MISTAKNYSKNGLALAILSVLGLAVIAPSAQAQIVISQIYPGGGSNTPGAAYMTDYIELFNNGPSVVDLAASGYSLQYASAPGTAVSTINTLQGTIASGDYYLVREGTAGTAGAALTTYNDIGTINLSATNGKVALAMNAMAPTTAATFTAGPNSTFSSNVVDFVGYGTTATAYEGTAAAPTPGSTANSIARTLTRGVYVDTNNNAADFTTENPPNPHMGAYVYVAPTPEPSGFVAMFIGAGVLGLLVVRRMGMKVVA